MRDATRRRIGNLGGEFLRELALLIGVFYPLDIYVQYGSVTALQSMTTVLTVTILWTVGVILDVQSADD